MAEIRRLLLRPAAFALLIAAAVISLFFTIRNEHAKWEGSAAVMETDAMILRTEYIRQMETLKELDLHSAVELLEKAREKQSQAVSYDYSYQDYVREVYVMPKLQACLSYPEFLEKIRENAEIYQKISLFSRENYYTLRNIRKTDADYQRVSGVQPELQVSDAIEDLLSNPVSDVLILVLCLCFTFLIPVERRNHLWELLHTTAAGRGRLFLLRLSSLIPALLFSMAAVYGPSFLYLASLYGMPDPSVYVQSVSLFRELSYPISLGAFLIFLMILRCISFHAVSLLFWVILESLSSAAVSMMISGFVFLLEYLFYRLISIQSACAILRVVNVFSCLDTVNIYGGYLNLDLLGFPVSAALCHVVFIILLILGSMAGLTAVYRFKRPKERNRILLSLEGLMFRTRDRLFRLLPRLSLGVYKTFFIQHGLLIFLLLLAGVTRLLPETRVYVAGAEYLAYIREEQLSAPFNDPKTVSFFSEEQEEIREAVRMHEELYQQYEEGILDELTWFMEENRISGIHVRQETLDLLERERSRLEKLYEERGICGWILNPQCYKQLLGEGKDLSTRYQIYAAAAVLAMCFLMSGAFSYEKKSRVQPMLHLTKKGGLTFFFRKEVLALLYALFTVLVIYLTDLIRVGELYPMHALDAPVQSLSWMEDVRISVTIRDYLILLTAYRVLMMFLMAQPVLLISSKTREPRISSLAAVGTLGITSFLHFIHSKELQYINMAYILEGRELMHRISAGNISEMLILCGWVLTFVGLAFWCQGANT